MKKLAYTIAGISMLASIGLAFDAGSDFKKFLKAEMPKMDVAFQKSDMSYFENISTADFTQTEMGQTVNKQAAMAGLKQSFEMMKGLKAKSTVTSSSVKGGVGTAFIHSTMSGTMTPPTQGAKPAKCEMELWEKQTWVKSGKGWKVKAISESKPMTMKMNGKSVDPAKAMGGG